MRMQRIRLYCKSCKQMVWAELLPEYSLLQSGKEVVLRQCVHITCSECDTDFEMPKLFEKTARQLKAQMALEKWHTILLSEKLETYCWNGGTVEKNYAS